MPSIEDVIRSLFEYLRAVESIEEPSINEIANYLKWNYLKTRTFTKSLEKLGLIETKWIPGPPQRYIITLTDKGKCIISCIRK